MKIATARTRTTAGAFLETRSTIGSMRERANRDRGPASPRLHRRKVAAARGPRNRFVYSPTRSGTKSNPVARSGSVPIARRAAIQPFATTNENRGTWRYERTLNQPSAGSARTDPPSHAISRVEKVLPRRGVVEVRGTPGRSGDPG